MLGRESGELVHDVKAVESKIGTLNFFVLGILDAARLHVARNRWAAGFRASLAVAIALSPSSLPITAP